MTDFFPSINHIRLPWYEEGLRPYPSIDVQGHRANSLIGTMPAAGDRPKTRQLVRWNDDLDKSLLLHISYTCTDLGIKIPYDEVARRMGATFTEGAIQQHLAKLRTKMAEQNVAPVPPPPKRGQVTKKPSTVYGQKQRVIAPPSAPAASKTQARRTSRAQPDGSSPQGVTKTRGRRKAASRKIKRSSSDPGLSDEEFAGEEDGDYTVVQINNHARGRGRPRKAQAAQANSGRKLSDQIFGTLAEADAAFDAENPDMAYEENGIFYPQEADPGQVYQSQEAVHHSLYSGQYGGQQVEGEEEEEEDLGQAARAAAVQQANMYSQFNPFESANYSQEEQLSPTSTMQMVNHNMPQMHPAVGTFDGQADQYAQYGFDQMHTMNAPGQGWGGFNEQQLAMPPPSTPMRTPASAFGPSPVLPAPVNSHAYSQVDSAAATRQNSMYSQASSLGTPIPQHNGLGLDGHISPSSTPHAVNFNNSTGNNFFGVGGAAGLDMGALPWSDTSLTFPADGNNGFPQLF